MNKFCKYMHVKDITELTFQSFSNAQLATSVGCQCIEFTVDHGSYTCIKTDRGCPGDCDWSLCRGFYIPWKSTNQSRGQFIHYPFHGRTFRILLYLLIAFLLFHLFLYQNNQRYQPQLFFSFCLYCLSMCCLYYIFVLSF